jgi:hypothetical protein
MKYFVLTVRSYDQVIQAGVLSCEQDAIDWVKRDSSRREYEEFELDSIDPYWK